MASRKNIQVIDGADNCTYDIFAASAEDFAQIFPDGQDVEFAEDFWKRVGKAVAAPICDRLWASRLDKKTVKGIHGTLFYQLRRVKKRFYPTRREAEMVTGFKNRK